MTRTLVTAIVSTAAPGAERGAQDAAIELGIGYGGWTAEHLETIYAEHAKPTRDRGLAVRLNVQDSDGTLIVSFADHATGRTAHAGELVKQQRKPAKHLVLPAGGRTRIPDAVRAALLEWIDAKHISVLHVVGPCEEQEPGIGQATHDALVWLLEDNTADELVSVVERVQLGTDGQPVEATRVVEADGEPLYQGMSMEPWHPIDTIRATECHGAQGDPATAGSAHETASGCASFATLAEAVDAAGALTADRRSELEQSLRQAEVEIRITRPIGDGIDVRLRSFANYVQPGPTAYIDCTDLTEEQIAAMLSELGTEP